MTMDRGEEQAHWIPGGKAVIEGIVWSWFRRTNPLRSLMPSRRDHLPETLARVGRSCHKLSMSGSCGWSLTIQCETQVRALLKLKSGARRVFFDTRKPAHLRIVQVSRRGQLRSPSPDRSPSRMQTVRGKSLATSLKRKRRALNDMYIRMPFACASGL